MNNTKHFTHPTLGINVYKGNVAYFDELEKKTKNSLFWLKADHNWLGFNFIITVLNPFFWMYILMMADYYNPAKGMEQFPIEYKSLFTFIAIDLLVLAIIKYKKFKNKV